MGQIIRAGIKIWKVFLYIFTYLHLIYIIFSLLYLSDPLFQLFLFRILSFLIFYLFFIFTFFSLFSSWVAVTWKTLFLFFHRHPGNFFVFAFLLHNKFIWFDFDKKSAKIKEVKIESQYIRDYIFIESITITSASLEMLRKIQNWLIMLHWYSFF